MMLDQEPGSGVEQLNGGAVDVLGSVYLVGRFLAIFSVGI